LAALVVVCVSAAALPETARAAATDRDAQRVRLPDSVERWRPLVRLYWDRWLVKYRHRHISAAEIRRALLIIQRESNGYPRAVNPVSGCAGLFQLLPGYARGRFDLFNPRTNISLAGMLYVRRGWRPWAL
jgi:hypothetical protein